MKQVVCKTDELRPGQIMEATFNNTAIVVCCTADGHYYAFTNKCIHQGAPLSKGKLSGTSTPTDTPGEYHYEREGEILRCPWHGREFDVKNGGCMLANPKFKLRDFKTAVEDNNVVVYK